MIMQFTYTAKSLRGEVTNGLLDAETIAAARQVLRDRGLFALTLVQNATGKAATQVARRGLWKQRVSKHEIMLLTSQLVIMSRAGVDLAESLKNVAATCRNPTLKAALDSIYEDVGQGLSFSAAMKKQTHLFGEAYLASVAAGEASGKVAEVLSRMADMLRNEIKLQTTLRSAMSYPLVLMVVCALVVAALMLFVLPQFEQVFADMGTTPPATTQFLLSLSGELRRRFWLWGALALAVPWLAFKIFWTARLRRLIDNLALRTIVIGEVLQSLVTGRLFGIMGTMLQSGVPLVQALQLCRSTMRSICYQELLDDMQEEILNGRTIGRVLNNAPVVPAGAAQMIGTAEQSGKLGLVMQMVGEYYESEGQRKIQDLAKLLEPAIIIVMGVVVAFVVASIMLPMLDISASAGQ